MHISGASLKRITAFVIIAAVLFSPLKIYAAGYLIDESVVSQDAYIEYVISMLATPQFPSHDSGKVVWQDDRNGSPEIYLYDLDTSTETQITSLIGSAQQWPDISGDVIVWEDSRNGNYDIYMYDIGTDTETQVTTDAGGSRQPSICGNKIVWHDDRNDLTTGYDIFVYDIPTTTESVLIDAAGDQVSPDCDNGVVVWEDYRGGLSDIYYYDFNDPIPDGAVVSTSATNQYWPTTDGATVSWTEDRGTGSGFDVYAYDLSADELITVTTDGNTQAFGHPDGDLLVFTDDRDGNWNVYIYNFTLREEFPLVTNGYDQGLARIQGNRVVWMDERNQPEYPGPTGLDGLMVEASTGQPFTGLAVFDGTGPTFSGLPRTTDPINTGDGVIDTNPFNIQVRPVDEGSGVDHVDFYADDTLLCTDRTPDENGVYECSWDPSETCGAEEIRVIATDVTGNTSLVLTRAVEISSDICPSLSDTGSNVLPMAVGAGSVLVAAAALPKAGVMVTKKRR
jgi:TolB protein